MKKFKYAIGIAAMAMFGACSSDAPEIVNNTADEGESEAYISIRFADTRGDDDDRNDTAEESEITKVEIFLVDKTTGETFFNRSTTTGINGTTAKFGVNKREYEDIKANASTLQMYVYANGVQDVLTGEALITGSQSHDLWPKTDGDNELGFTMSCDGPYNVTFVNSDVSGKSDAPLTISAEVKMVRLATRFDYVEQNNNSYTTTANKAVKMEISGIGIETFAETTYRVPQFSTDGKPSQNMKHFTKPDDVGDTKYYRVTDIAIKEFTAENPKVSYFAHSYPIRPLQENGARKTYAKPNTISTDVKNAGKAQYDRIPYTVIRARFDVENSISMHPQEEGQKPEDVYSIRGIFIGGLRDLQKMQADNKKFTITHDLTVQAEKDEITLIEKNIQSILDGETLTEDILKTQMGYLGAEVYSYVKNTSRNLDGYYTYYSHFIEHQSNAESLSWKYGVSRNLIYQIGVNSFKYLGATGDKYPGDGPSSPDLSDLFVQLTVSIVDWEINYSNSAWDFK